MEIESNILKYYLKNCYFINGTACAGKSTMCRMLAEKYDMLYYEENYNMDTMPRPERGVLEFSSLNRQN